MNSLQDNRTKAGRSLPRVWRRFAFLRHGEEFDFKGRTYAAAFFKGRRPLGLPLARVWLDMERRAWIFPWTRVRTYTLVRDANRGAMTMDFPHDTVAREIDERLTAIDRLDLKGQVVLTNNDDNRTGTSS